jgi:hypothetical protein
MRSMTRRVFSGALVLSPFVAALPGHAAGIIIEVWTGPSCSCCHDWVEHLENNGFDVTVHNGGNVDARKRLGMPVDYGSCHSAEVEGFAIEGHVSADEIRRLLAERPDAIGLAVPSMPLGSPGMDGPEYGGVRNPYDVFLIQRDGMAVVYASHPKGN